MEGSHEGSSDEEAEKKKKKKKKDPTSAEYAGCCLCICLIILLSLGFGLSPEDEVTTSSVGTNFGLANYSYAEYLQDFANAVDRGNGGSSEIAALDSDDPRAKALDWIKNDDTIENSNSGQSTLVSNDLPVALALERFVLATIYYSVVGDSSNANDSHELETSFGFLGTDSICNWRSQFFLGVWCDQDEQVEEVSIYNVDDLTGNIPSEVALLQDLKKLHISDLTGSSEMPSEIGNLEKLQTLLLTNVGFYGDIPTQLNQLYELTNLDLSQNSFNGTLPSELGDLFAVQTISLANNNLNGTLPTELGFLSQMTSLDLSNNDFSDQIATEMGQLSSLKELKLDNNDFGGGIPTEIYQLSTLTSLTIQDNVELKGDLDPLCNNVDLDKFEGVADCADGEPFCYCCFCF